jgi:hypothetical protein
VAGDDASAITTGQLDSLLAYSGFLDLRLLMVAEGLDTIAGWMFPTAGLHVVLGEVGVDPIGAIRAMALLGT